MSSDPEPLAAKMSARLCHDMVNPLGAIANGLELLELSGQAQGPELDLIRASVNEAAARLRFLRLAFGPGIGDRSIPRDEALAAVSARYGALPTSVSWQSGPEITRAQAKAIFLGLMAMEAVTARGGEISVQEAAPGAWVLTARSPKPLIDQKNWQRLQSDTEAEADPPASLIHFTALQRHMAPDGRRLEVMTEPDGVTLRLTV